jgi:hypothetical protein
MRAMIEVEVHLYNSLVRFVPKYEPLRFLAAGAAPSGWRDGWAFPSADLPRRNGYNILKSFGGAGKGWC